MFQDAKLHFGGNQDTAPIIQGLEIQQVPCQGAGYPGWARLHRVHLARLLLVLGRFVRRHLFPI